MAQHSISIKTPWSPERAFEFMADLRNIKDWDPGVHSVELVAGDGPGMDSAFDVTVDGFSGPMTLTYVVTSFDSPKSLSVKAENDLLTSHDHTTVVLADSGSIVTYSATFTLSDSLGISDDDFAKTFEIVGNKAGVGLAGALDGSLVD
jgi:hypothetical protein